MGGTIGDVVTLRLFAGLREIAGTGRVEIEASSVGLLLDEAARRYGRDFAAGMQSARVWIDGEPLEADDPMSVDLSGRAEVALIPPVSGGAP